MVSPATACVQASVVIAAVLVVRACLAKKAPPAVFCDMLVAGSLARSRAVFP